MTLTTSLPVASSPPIRTFERKILAAGVAPETTSDVLRCPVINIADHSRKQIEVPPKHRPIGEVAAEWARDEKRRQALAEARQWVADTFHGQDGDTVRTLRLRRGWSQSRLAEAIGSSQSHVARIERGTENLAMQTCRRLCEVLEIDMNTLDQALRRQEIMARAKGAAG